LQLHDSLVSLIGEEIGE